MSPLIFNEIVLLLKNNIRAELEIPTNILGTLTEQQINEFVDALKNNPRLVTLHLGRIDFNLDSNNTGLRPSHTITLAQAISHHQSLRNLYLAHNSIADNGANALANAIVNNIHLSSLLWILLDNNLIGPEGAKYLAQALDNNCSVQELRLVNNQIGDVGAQHLAVACSKNCTLTGLSLFGNNICTALRKSITQLLSKNRQEQTTPAETPATSITSDHSFLSIKLTH